MTHAPRQHRPRKCGRCGQPCAHGFGPPAGRKDLGTVFACADHLGEAEAWRRKTYPGPGSDRRRESAQGDLFGG